MTLEFEITPNNKYRSDHQKTNKCQFASNGGYGITSFDFFKPLVAIGTGRKGGRTKIV